MVLFESFRSLEHFAGLAAQGEPALVTFDCLSTAKITVHHAGTEEVACTKHCRTTLLNSLHICFSSPKAPAVSMAAISSEDNANIYRSEPLQTVDPVKPTYITCRDVTLQARLL
jgi:hypothetical protein